MAVCEKDTKGRNTTRGAGKGFTGTQRFNAGTNRRRR